MIYIRIQPRGVGYQTYPSSHAFGASPCVAPRAPTQNLLYSHHLAYRHGQRTLPNAPLPMTLRNSKSSMVVPDVFLPRTWSPHALNLAANVLGRRHGGARRRHGRLGLGFGTRAQHRAATLDAFLARRPRLDLLERMEPAWAMSIHHAHASPYLLKPLVVRHWQQKGIASSSPQSSDCHDGRFLSHVSGYAIHPDTIESIFSLPARIARMAHVRRSMPARREDDAWVCIAALGRRCTNAR